MQADTVNGRDLDRAANLSDQAAKMFVELGVRGKDVLRFAIENFAGSGQLDLAAAADAFEQTAFEFFFERAYLLADRRLCDKVAFSRQRETLQIDQIAKNL